MTGAHKKEIQKLSVVLGGQQNNWAMRRVRRQFIYGLCIFQMLGAAPLATRCCRSWSRSTTTLTHSESTSSRLTTSDWPSIMASLNSRPSRISGKRSPLFMKVTHKKQFLATHIEDFRKYLYCRRSRFKKMVIFLWNCNTDFDIVKWHPKISEVMLELVTQCNRSYSN